MNWGILSIAIAVYVVFYVGSVLIAEYVVKNRFLVFLVSALIALAGLITSLLLRIFGDLSIFWKELTVDLAIFSFVLIIIEVIDSIKARKREREIALFWKALEPSPEFKKHLDEMKEELEDPNRPHAHD